jgi:signal transduction histidine kinase
MPPVRPPPNHRWLPHWVSARWLVPVIYAGCLLAFLADIHQDNTLAYGMFYVPLVCTAVFHRRSAALWWLTSISCGMVIVGAFLPGVSTDLSDLIGNRIISLIVVLATAIFIRHARKVQEQLAEQTKRVEAAERVKTEVFTNLSQEIRTPLHSMVGLLEIMMANCRPDQRLSLSQVQAAGKRLLATIENLIDLTQIEERVIRSEPVDIVALLSQAAEANRASAIERQIGLEIDIPASTTVTAQADSWAVRRIVDNLIANAVKYSRPGGDIIVSVETEPGTVVVLISDAGVGMPPEVLRQIGEPFFQADGSTGTGTGLALSYRLAGAMGARLVFASEQGAGTTAMLRLPA